MESWKQIKLYPLSRFISSSTWAGVALRLSNTWRFLAFHMFHAVYMRIAALDLLVYLETPGFSRFCPEGKLHVPCPVITWCQQIKILAAASLSIITKIKGLNMSLYQRQILLMKLVGWMDPSWPVTESLMWKWTNQRKGTAQNLPAIHFNVSKPTEFMKSSFASSNIFALRKGIENKYKLFYLLILLKIIPRMDRAGRKRGKCRKLAA